MRDGLNNISFDQHRAGQLFKDLQACHIAALRGEKDEPDPETEDLLIAEGVVLGDQTDAEAVKDASFDLARGLKVGQWLDWQQDDTWVRGKLSWRSEVTGNCIFVNRKGMKLAEMSVNGIAVLLRAGQARVLEDLNTPLMDRALNAVVDALQDTDVSENPV